MKIEDTIIKYPRTPHIQGSRLQPGDEDLRQRPFSDITGRNVVLEEKIDGANSAVSFTNEGELRSSVSLRPIMSTSVLSILKQIGRHCWKETVPVKMPFHIWPLRK